VTHGEEGGGAGGGFFGGPRPIGAIIPKLTRPAFKRRNPAGAMLMAEWPAVVGPAIAAVTQPLRLTSGTLVLGCTGPVAMELSHLAPELLGRINAHLGRVAVERLRFVQQAPSRTEPVRPKPAPPAPLPGPLKARIEELPDGELKAALAKLAEGVYRNPR
jgi:hypothetical protein